MANRRFTPKQVAEHYPGIFTTGSLAVKRHRGDGPKFVKIGSRVIYREEDIEAFLADRLRNSTSDPGNQNYAA